MKQAFLITAYTDAQQLNRLVSSLDGPNSFFYFHLDKKSQLHGDPVIVRLKKKSNMHFIQDPVHVQWGGFSHLKAILLLMQAANKKTGIDYIHALSGQDLAVVPLSAIETFLQVNKGKEFMTYARLDYMNWSGGSYSRLQYYHLNDWFNIRAKFWKRINARWLQLQRLSGFKRKLQTGFDHWYGGSTWWSLSSSAVDHILKVLEARPALLDACAYTHCAEEILFHTILLNSEFKDRVANNDLRYIDWNTRNGSCPAILDETDLEPIRKSKKLFARKFVSGISDKLSEKISNNISFFESNQ